MSFRNPQGWIITPPNIFTIKDLRDMKLDVPMPLFSFDGCHFVRHYFERTEIDYIYDRTIKRPYRIAVLHDGKWYDIDDASQINSERQAKLVFAQGNIKDTDPVGPGFLLYKDRGVYRK